MNETLLASHKLRPMFGAMLVAIALLPTTGSAQVRTDATDQATILVSGEGREMVQPDRATVILAVETRGRTSLQAGTDNAKLMKGIRDGLLRMGLSNDQVSTQTFMLYPQQESSGEITAFLATNAIRVELRDLEMISRVVDTAMVLGATRIGSLTYSASDTKAAMRASLVKAMESARERAAAIAEASGGKLGALVEVITDRQGHGQGYIASGSVVATGSDGGMPGTGFNPRDIPVVVGLTARWRFVATP